MPAAEGLGTPLPEISPPSPHCPGPKMNHSIFSFEICLPCVCPPSLVGTRFDPLLAYFFITGKRVLINFSKLYLCLHPGLPKTPLTPLPMLLN